MNKYRLDLELSGRGNKGHITLEIESHTDNDADLFAEALAELMPTSSYYCQKNSCQIDSNWYGNAVKIN